MNQDIFHFRQYGQIYPGSDINPDPAIARRCVLHVHVKDLEPYLKGEKSFQSGSTSDAAAKDLDVDACRRKLIAIAGDRYDAELDQVTVDVDAFPVYGQNKQWAMDAVARLVEAVRDPAVVLEDKEAGKMEQKSLDGQKKVPAFPEAWKRPDMAGMMVGQEAASRSVKAELLEFDSVEEDDEDELDYDSEDAYEYEEDEDELTTIKQ